MTIMSLLPVLSGSLLLLLRADGYAPLQHQTQAINVQRLQTAPGGNDDGNEQSSRSSLQCGILISSWSNGVVGNEEVLDFLKKGLVTSLLKDQQRQAEVSVKTSVMASPCCGPDWNALQKMEFVDSTLARLQQQDPEYMHDEWLLEQLDDNDETVKLKMVYIPTAMYALRADSTNTPGTQRQRARADGKKRRTQIIDTIGELFDEKLTISAVTLDLDDGSVKQPEGDDDGTFPTNGKEALLEWAPHFIYVEGGNTFWLHHCMTKGDWQAALLCAIERGAVYMGKSAGAILAGASMETATWKGWDDASIVPGMERYSDWKGVEGLNLVRGASFFPHMSDEWNELTQAKQQEQLLGKLYCLTDEQVCLVSEESVQVVSATAPEMSHQ